MKEDLQSHFQTCTEGNKFDFVHFWALGPIAIDSSRNFRSNGPGPIDFHEFLCVFGSKQVSTSSWRRFLLVSAFNYPRVAAADLMVCYGVLADASRGVGSQWGGLSPAPTH